MARFLLNLRDQRAHNEGGDAFGLRSTTLISSGSPGSLRFATDMLGSLRTSLAVSSPSGVGDDEDDDMDALTSVLSFDMEHTATRSEGGFHDGDLESLAECPTLCGSDEGHAGWKEGVLVLGEKGSSWA